MDNNKKQRIKELFALIFWILVLMSFIYLLYIKISILIK